MSEPVSFASLPLEIQGMVASFLGQHDLVRCVLVCHDWRDCFSHSLWGYLMIYNYSSICFCLENCKQNRQANNHLFMESARSGALRIYGHNLRSLEIYVNDDDMLREYLELAPSTFPYMTSLHVVGCVTEDDLIADLIRRCTGGLKRLVCGKTECVRAVGNVSFGPESVKAFFRHVPTIEVFFAKESAFSSLEIQRLLCSAPKLKYFHILPYLCSGCWVDHQPCLQAADVVGENWACTGLESFCCLIRGVSRWDLNSIFPDDTSRVLTLKGSPQESIDLQRQVYTQLGRLVHLRELCLGVYTHGHDDWYDRHHIPEFLQQDCLSMTLESGMALLHALKNLRLVDLVHMIVGFGDEERRWVEEFWPEATVTSDDYGPVNVYFNSD